MSALSFGFQSAAARRSRTFVPFLSVPAIVTSRLCHAPDNRQQKSDNQRNGASPHEIDHGLDARLDHEGFGFP
jgi:hypothetical protein